MALQFTRSFEGYGERPITKLYNGSIFQVQKLNRYLFSFDLCVTRCVWVFENWAHVLWILPIRPAF